MDEKEIKRLMGHDFSAGTEAFRDALLERCLNSLDKDGEGIPLDDSDLELLAAAGDPFATPKEPDDAI